MSDKIVKYEDMKKVVDFFNNDIDTEGIDIVLKDDYESVIFSVNVWLDNSEYSYGELVLKSASIDQTIKMNLDYKIIYPENIDFVNEKAIIYYYLDKEKTTQKLMKEFPFEEMYIYNEDEIIEYEKQYTEKILVLHDYKNVLKLIISSKSTYNE